MKTLKKGFSNALIFRGNILCIVGAIFDGITFGGVLVQLGQESDQNVIKNI